ncbi:hypothetical protein AXE80_03465 [Wenyingzhuangia fucanilytica]|uniref:Carbohydrate-binding protein SusD n=2 Tax=Wenyingzhuangia fucanilytica TaxID=1790137 RepID=A0A1B1Y3N5_9FLAO|nr:hypothetical protein AXE80_03465 [Wenyingzhuangia fucanilytica]
MAFFTSCEDDFIDLNPPSEITDDVYYKDAEHFLTGSNNFYNELIDWSYLGDLTDHGSDLIGHKEESPLQDYSRGNTQPPENESSYFDDIYASIRNVNLLIARAAEYDGDQNDIKEYVAAAHFFRAYHYFFLMQRYGGIPIVVDPLDVDSPSLSSSRSSRYQVTSQIISDLDLAIADLPSENNIGTNDKGKISIEAAKAFKAEVLLHEATWMKYVGTTTDGDGTTVGAGTAGYNPANINTYLQEVVTLTKSIMDSGIYELWDYNNVLNNMSSYFLFNLEDGGSNPAGLDKSTNKEFIFYGKYDYTFRQSRQLVSHVSSGRLKPSRKMMDMFLCTDGLPIDDSPLFQGYTNASDEYQNRDYRMRAYFGNHEANNDIPADGSVLLNGENQIGTFSQKFVSWTWPIYRESREEGFDLPFIRLADVYLMYAEALYELNGSLTDTQLDESINLIKARAGVAPISNAFLTANNLNLETEIRRERTIELFAETSRYNDLRRWGIAEQELNQDIYGAVIEGTAYESNPALYDPSLYFYGEKDAQTGDGVKSCLLLEPASVRNFSRHNYLYPLPTAQIALNEAMLQNPGY